MKEQERKFLMNTLPDGIPPNNCKFIRQGYLMIAGDRHLRLRIIDHNKAILGFKTIESKWVRNEYECQIPIEEARELFNSSLCFLEKRRYTTVYKGNHVDIDVYPNGLIIGEIEFTDAEGLQLPPYFIKEITGMSKYSNLVMAVHDTWKGDK